MSGIEIDINADPGDVNKAVDSIGKSIERVNRIKWSPIDLKAIERDLKKAEQMFRDFQRRTGINPGAGFGAPPISGGPAPSSGGSPGPGLPPGAPGGYGPSPAGPGRHGGRRGRGRYSPGLHNILSGLTGGFGGGLGRIGSAGIQGAFSGGASGGMLGGGMGLLKGLGIGALAFGAFKVGQSVNEGFEMAKDRAITLDTLKRQMGDVGKSFEVLKAATEEAGRATMLNSKESAKLMAEFNRLGRGVDKTEEALMGSAITSGRTARAYGLDPTQGASFFAGVRHIDPRQNNKELALLIGETVNKSGMAARADEVMDAIKGFAAATARMSLSSPNLAGFAGAYGEMTGAKIPGLTGEVAAQILGMANQSVMRMGGAGEAGQALMLRGFNKFGRLNPIESMALAEGGLFGTRRGVFGGADNQISKFIGGGRAASIAGGSGADVTNLQAIQAAIKNIGGDKWFQLEGAKRMFGVSSLSQAASLMNLSGSQAGGLSKAVRAAGVDLSTVNESGLQTLAGIGGATDKSQLKAIMEDMGRRSGKGALTESERSTLDTASRGSLDDMRTAMIKVAATKDQEQTDAKQMIESLAQLDSIRINIGDKLIPAANTMRDALVMMAGKGQIGEVGLRREAYRVNMKEAADFRDERISQIAKEYGSARATQAGGIFAGGVQGMAFSIDRVRGANEAQSQAIADANRQYNARADYLTQQEQAAIAADATGATSNGSTPLPPGASTKSTGAKDQVDVNVMVKSQSVAPNGQVMSESSASSRVNLPRGSGNKSVAVDAR